MVPIKVFDYDARNLPNEVLEAIGLVISVSTQTENIVREAIGGCLQIDMEMNGALTAHMNMGLRFDTLKSIAEMRIDDLDDLDELDILLDHCKVGFTERNKIAHCQWYRDPENDSIFIVKESSRGRYEMTTQLINAEQIRLEAEYIYWAGLDLFAFLRRVDLLPDYPPIDRIRDHKSPTNRKKLRAQKATTRN